MMDIIVFAEQYRDFHFIPGNVYNQDVVEKVRLAQALLVAVDAMKKSRQRLLMDETKAKIRDGGPVFSVVGKIDSAIEDISYIPLTV